MSRARLVAALAAAAFAAPAPAFVRTTSESTGVPLFWPTPVVPYNLSSAPSFTSPTCGAGGERMLEAVRAGFSAWKQGCANLDLVYAGRIDEVRTGSVGTAENVVVLRHGWCSTNTQAAACMNDPDADCAGTFDCFEDRSPADRSIVALTSTLYDPDTGRIIDADVEVNAWDGVVGTLPAGGQSPAHGFYFTCDKQQGWAECTRYGEDGCFSYDLQATVTHEAGHFLGLRHPCYAGSPADADLPSCLSPLPPGATPYAETTMFPSTRAGDLNKRTLSDDDVAGVCAIYAEAGGSGCETGGETGSVAALLAALALWPRRKRA